LENFIPCLFYVAYCVSRIPFSTRYTQHATRNTQHATRNTLFDNIIATSRPPRQFLTMRIVTSVAAMQRLARRWQTQGFRVGFVPTMGYLHAGHISLVKRARQLVGPRGRVVVSIYVNPTQFGPNEDLSRYPRDFARDKKSCRAAGVDVIFAPGDGEMYPQNSDAAYSTYVVEETLSRGMEGVSRPTHFRGVTTVVAKLFNIVLPEVAVFGAKDFQQAAIVQRMVRDLNFPVKIIVAPTHREPDGLALSSRNKYLSPAQREQAVVLSHALQLAKKIANHKPVSAHALKTQLQRFIAAQPEARLDYLEFFDPQTLQPATKVVPGVQMALAVFFGKTRLIDNARL
jgi:pantoate--beta-alanine ligase